MKKIIKKIVLLFILMLSVIGCTEKKSKIDKVKIAYIPFPLNVPSIVGKNKKIYELEKEIENKKKVSQINIEKREGKYYLSYLKNGLKLYFSKYNLDIFDLLVEFYNENVYDSKLKKAS